MAARGRGRGRGRGLEKLGVEKGEALPERALGPPDTFPPLLFHPVKSTQERSLAESYQLVIKKEFKEHMQNSEYFISPEVKKSDIERYSDRYQMLTHRPSGLTLDWSRFPKELQKFSAAPKKKRKLPQSKLKPNAKVPRTKDINIKEKLEALEKQETTIENEGEPEEGDEEEEGEETAEVGLEEEDIDEELDEGTDYVNNYFDNGEDYLDDDDNALEDEGVY